MFNGKRATAQQAAAVPANKKPAATAQNVQPVKSIRSKKRPTHKPKLLGGAQLLHHCTVQFPGEGRDIQASLFLVKIPAKGDRPAQIVAHGWEIERVTPDHRTRDVVQDDTLYHVTVGNVTYPVLTVAE